MPARTVDAIDLVEGDLIDLLELDVPLATADEYIAEFEYAAVEGTLVLDGGSVLIYNDLANVVVPRGQRVVVHSAIPADQPANAPF